MAMLDTHLLDDLDAFRLLEGDWTDGGDDFVDFVLDGCLWCTTGEAGDCRHAIGQVEAGVLTLGGLPGPCSSDSPQASCWIGRFPSSVGIFPNPIAS